MRSIDDADELKEAKEELLAQDWQIDALKKNPEYVHWGNHEDYMCNKDGGWTSPIEIENMASMYALDELNECGNFYFFLERKSIECEACDRSGYNPETKKISDDWYDFEGTGRKWCSKITQDEVQALIDHNRLFDLTHGKEKGYVPTAEEVNSWANGRGFGHDAINRWICIETRAKRLGVYGQCEHCHGKGTVFVEDTCKLKLQLWMLLPRKGASRGVLVNEITQEQLPAAIEFLKGAAKRNADRFGKL